MTFHFHSECGSVGIGRRARLRILWQQCRVGSSPIFRITFLRKSLDFQGFFCIILCFSILLKFLQSLSYYSVFYYFLIPFFIIYCSISYRHRSFTTSPAMISPATDGTNATLPGISRRSVHLCSAPGGQIQFVLQLIAISSIGLVGCSSE